MDLKSIKNKLNALQTQGQKKEKVDYSKYLWKPKQEGKYQIRIVPSKLDKNNPFKEVFVHYGFSKFPIYALTNWGEKDPIVEFAAQLRKTNDKENWSLAKKIEPKMRVFVPVVVRGEEDKGVRMWQFGKEMYLELLGIAEDEDIGDYTDIMDGRDLTIDTVGPEVTGTKFNKSSVRIKPKTSPLSEDNEQVKAWITNQADVLTLYKKYEFDEMKTMLMEWLEPSEESTEETTEEVVETPVQEAPKANYALNTKKKGFDEDEFDGMRWYSILAEHRVNKWYTAPTAIRRLMRMDKEIVQNYNLSELRLILSVGEPLHADAVRWGMETFKVPLLDNWWQTETGAIMISPLPGVTATKPGSAMKPLPGISAEVVDDKANPVGNGKGGYLTLTEPWPSMTRGVWGETQRFIDTYWSRFNGMYFAGDGAKLDDDGAFWVLGRVDDVMNVSGHRISTTEVESALVSHEAVAEAAVVGANDAMTGQAIVAFVILRGGVAAASGSELEKSLKDHVSNQIGAIAKPKKIMVVAELPKTRSGKIMRRLLRDVAENRQVGDATTLADPNVMKLISEGLNSGKSED